MIRILENIIVGIGLGIVGILWLGLIACIINAIIRDHNARRQDRWDREYYLRK